MTASSASPHAHRYSIDMLIDAGSLDRARTQLTSALATWPDDAELLATGARLDLRAGHLPGALWYANSALRRNPTNTQALRIRSLIQAADGFCYDAQIDALAAIRIEPHQAANHYVLAYAYNEEGRKKDALASINEALRLAPENVAYLNFRGSLKSRAIGSQDALEDFAAALRINPQDGPTLQNIGQTQSRQWQLTRSLRTYLDAAAHDVHSAKRSRVGIAATMRRIAIFMSSLNLAALAIIGFNAHRDAPPDPGTIALLARLCALALDHDSYRHALGGDICFALQIPPAALATGPLLGCHQPVHLGQCCDLTGDSDHSANRERRHRSRHRHIHRSTGPRNTHTRAHPQRRLTETRCRQCCCDAGYLRNRDSRAR